MSDNSAIEWTDTTWNPILGCTRVSPGCDRCYAITQARIRAGNPNPKVATAFTGLTERGEAGTDWTGRVNLLPDRLVQPLSWRKPRKVFVNSLSDLFHEDVPDEYIARVFAVMAATPQHTYQILTKRHGRMRSLLRNKLWWQYEFAAACRARGVDYATAAIWDGDVAWLPNAWLGVSTEDQHWARIRVHALLSVPAAVRWVSAEPLLGAIDLRNLEAGNGALIDALHGDVKTRQGEIYAACPGSVSWVVAGGESGPGARPMHPEWARSLRDQCRDARVPFLFKQHGDWIGGYRIDYDQGEAFHPVSDHTLAAWHWPGDDHPAAHEWPDGVAAMRVGKKQAGRLLDGREWNQFPVAAERPPGEYRDAQARVQQTRKPGAA